jgi:hypothetical protein
MKENIKDKWVAALKSGEYEQGKSFLKCDDKFCCLGVLTDLHIKENGREWEMSSSEGVYKYEVNSMFLSGSVVEWAGLKSRTGNLPESLGKSDGGHNLDDLTVLNDEGEYTFEQIAEVIENNWEYL